MEDISKYIIICVFGCATIKKYKEELLKITETWGKRANEKNIKVLYFLGEELTDLIGEEFIYLKSVNNDYLSASYKQNLGLKYIHEHFDYKFVFCCGSDTYINIDKLISYVSTLDCNDKIYIGGDTSIRNIQGKNIIFHGGGGGFLLSQVTLSYLYPFLEKMVENWLTLLIDNYKYDYHELRYACDVCLAYYLQRDGFLQKIKTENNLFYSCDYNGVYNDNYNRGTQVNLKNLITCHNMTLAKFDAFTEILIKNNYFM
jgi:hypothetical protein